MNVKLTKKRSVVVLQGYVPLISLNALHQVHIFIFFLAVFHVIYSAITMMLGRAKVSFIMFSYVSVRFDYWWIGVIVVFVRVDSWMESLGRRGHK